MNFIRLTILLGVAFGMNVMISNSSNISISNSHQNVNCNTNLSGDLPNAYEVRIFFNDENYEHTHTFNGGIYQINIEINDSPSFLSSGKLNQINCNLNCSISTDNGVLTGNISIQRTITVLGDKEESEMREMLRNNIIDTILKEIHKI